MTGPRDRAPVTAYRASAAGPRATAAARGRMPCVVYETEAAGLVLPL